MVGAATSNSAACCTVHLPAEKQRTQTGINYFVKGWNSGGRKLHSPLAFDAIPYLLDSGRAQMRKEL